MGNCVIKNFPLIKLNQTILIEKQLFYVSKSHKNLEQGDHNKIRKII